MSNPFHKSMDAFRGRRCRIIASDGTTYEGWVERVHHHDRHVALRDATRVDEGRRDGVGRALVTHANRIVELDADSHIERVPVDDVQDAPWSAGEWNPAENRQYIREVRDRAFVGSYPVVREVDGGLEVIEGHKRLWVCDQAGLDTHPVEVVDVDEWTAAHWFCADHFPDLDVDEPPAGCYDDEQIREAIAILVERWGVEATSLPKVDDHLDRLGLRVQGMGLTDIETQSDPDAPDETEGDSDTETQPSDTITERDPRELPEFEELVDEDGDDTEPSEETTPEDDRDNGEGSDMAVEETLADGPDDDDTISSKPEVEVWLTERLGDGEIEVTAGEIADDVETNGTWSARALNQLREADAAPLDIERSREDDPNNPTIYTICPIGYADSGGDHRVGDPVDEPTDAVWCGVCGEGPFEPEDIKKHNDVEDHPEEPIVLDHEPEQRELTGPDTNDDVDAVATRLPEDVTVDDVETVLDERGVNCYMSNVADDLGMDENKTRTVLHLLGRYGDVIDARPRTRGGESA